MDSGDLARRIARRSSIKDPGNEQARKHGEAAARVISAYLERHSLGAPRRVLDFGCGSGRVLIPLSHLYPDVDFDGTDVDEEAVQYLASLELDNVSVRVNPYEGALPYGESLFDAVFAISVWSHLPESLSRHWLTELGRVLRPGGLALVSVPGRHSLIRWQETDPPWKQVTLEEFESKGFIYVEYPGLKSKPEKFPGVTQSWGKAVIHSSYIEENWTDLFEVVSVDARGMNGNQDMVVMRKR